LVSDGYGIQEITAEYEFPYDNNLGTSSLVSNTTTSSTMYNTHACKTIPFSDNHQTNETTKVRSEQNNESDYLEASSITLGFDYKQTSRFSFC
jgi:hypothetical protein